MEIRKELNWIDADYQKSALFKSILITAGPIQVAEEMSERYGFDQVFGSEYEVLDGVFTG